MSVLERPLPTTDSDADKAALAERLMWLGTQMLKLAGEMTHGNAGDGASQLAGGGAMLGILAEETYRDRRKRARHFPKRLLGEPAWDILLDLYAAAGRGQEVSVSSACLAADAPPSTALRWLQHLEDEGLVERLPDPTDARRHFARLTDAGRERMNAYFADCRGDGDDLD